MSKIKSPVLSILWSISIIILGYLALRIVNLPRTWVLDTLLGLDLDLKGFPVDIKSQIIYLSYIFIAGFIGSLVVGILVSRKPWIHLWVFFGLLLINDIYAIVTVLSNQPIWVKVVILLTLFPQVWLGGKLALAMKTSKPG